VSLSRRPRPLSGAAAVILVMFLSACDPPGKPGIEEDQAAVPMDFKTIYNGNCAGCHGANGRQGPGRVLNDPLYLTVSTKDNIRSIVVHGRPGTLMPAFAQSDGGQLTDKQIDALVNGIESDWAKPFNSRGAPLPSYDEAGFTGDAAHGKKLFLKDCFACHAPGGIAGALNDPAYLSLSSNQNLRTSIIVGRPDFPGLQMPNYLMLNAGHALADQDIADLVSFLSSLRPPNSAIAMAEMKKLTAVEGSKPQERNE
jgi:cytochrome c oxidase cbb3-type subunit 3